MRWALVLLLVACGDQAKPHAAPDSGPTVGDGSDAPVAPHCPTPATTAPLSCAKPWFPGRVTPSSLFPESGFPNSGHTVTGDFDRDGRLDAAAASGGTFVDVYRGTGAGLFDRSSLQVAADVQDIAAGDLDGDGWLDLVTVSVPVGGGPGAISVLLNDMTGSFVPAQSLVSTGDNPWSVITADTNRDGHLDLVVGAAGSSLGGVEVFANLGTGTFGAPVNYPLAADPLETPRSVAAGDINGDGRIDLVAVSSTALYVMRGRANGFASPTRYSVALYPVAVTLADVNNDSRPDVLVSGDNLDGSGKGAVTVLPSSGTGTFPTATVYTTSARSNGVVVGDVDGDGDEDLAVATWYGRQTSLFLNTGNGSFGTEQLVDTGTTTAVSLEDFDGDGGLDLGTYWNGLAVYLGRDDGSFLVGPPVPVYPTTLRDLDRDGKQDLLGVAGGELTMALSLGSGMFTGSRQLVAAAPPVTFGDVSADLNGDGFDDALALSFMNRASASSLSVLPSHGDGTFSMRTSYPTTGANARWLAVADVSGDCAPDVVVANASQVDTLHNVTYPGSTDLFVNDGHGALGAPTRLAGAALVVMAGDVTGDGWADILLEETDGLHLLRNAGNGVFQVEERIDGHGLNGLVDLDHDGNLDIVADHVLLGHGDGTFGLPLDGQTPKRGLWDIDGDGNVDGLDWSSLDWQSIFFGRGDGTFVKSCCWRSLSSAGDVDGDGRTDLVGSRALLQRCL